MSRYDLGANVGELKESDRMEDQSMNKVKFGSNSWETKVKYIWYFKDYKFKRKRKGEENTSHVDIAKITSYQIGPREEK